MEIIILPRGYNDHYEKLEPNSAFAIAVNKHISDYWARTGAVIQAEWAIIEVLAEFYENLTPNEPKLIQ